MLENVGKDAIKVWDELWGYPNQIFACLAIARRHLVNVESFCAKNDSFLAATPLSFWGLRLSSSFLSPLSFPQELAVLSLSLSPFLSFPLLLSSFPLLFLLPSSFLYTLFLVLLLSYIFISFWGCRLGRRRRRGGALQCLGRRQPLGLGDGAGPRERREAQRLGRLVQDPRGRRRCRQAKRLSLGRCKEGR